ncbi:biotin transporter BioY [Devosia sp. D6-9]|nr:biotin transporter BioY [Devosia sp. D6-9]
MPSINSSPARNADLLSLGNRPLAVKAAAVVAGSLFLALASQIEVPIGPVPMTIQTLALTLVGALYGWRLGALTVIAWLGEAMIGLPVLSGGSGGAVHFVGPTAGYLWSFPVMVAMVGWLAERGWSGANFVRSFAAALLGNALALVAGWAYLATIIGAEAALAAGVTPFILGAVLKSGLHAALLKGVDTIRAPRS